MAEHPIQGLMNVTMEKIHQMVDSNTIIGKPIKRSITFSLKLSLKL